MEKSNMIKLQYFSAHWCPPCRGFTPKLAEFFENVNSCANEAEIDIKV